MSLLPAISHTMPENTEWFYISGYLRFMKFLLQKKSKEKKYFTHWLEFCIFQFPYEFYIQVASIYTVNQW